MQSDNKPRNNSILGVLLVGCMFIGMGAGLLAGQLTAGLFIGMGVGLLAAILMKGKK